ncbi:MAG: carbamoyltransferase N-terminal domain-containing protein, partial [Planctomycetota bacterium]
GFPGGPVVDRLARGRDPGRVVFKRTLPEGLNFSFSGIKTAVLYRVRGQDAKGEMKLTEEEKLDIAAGFQDAVVDVLVEQSLQACARTGVRRLAVGGGVASNSRLREKMKARAEGEGIEVYFPPARFCTDNAAMIAGLAYPLLRAGRVSDLFLDAVPAKVRA